MVSGRKRSGVQAANERLWRKYLQYKQDHEGMTSQTRYSYYRMFMRFTDYVGRTSFGVVKTETIEAFIACRTVKASGRRLDGEPTLVGLEASANTRKNRTTYLKGLFAWLHARGHISANPMALIGTPKVFRGDVEVFDEEVWKALWASALSDYDRVGFGSGMFFGLRRMEMVGLQARHFRNGWLVGFGRKGSYTNKPVPWLSCVRMYGKHRPDLIGGDVRTFLDPLTTLLRAHPKGLLLEGWRPKVERRSMYAQRDGWMSPERAKRHLEMALEAVGFAADAGTLHDLRRSCGTNLQDWGAHLRVVQEILGHEKVETTSRYTKVRTTALDELLSDDGFEDFGPWS